MSPAADAPTMLALVAQLCGVGVLLQSLEFLWNWRELPEDRLLGWTPSRIPAANPVTRLARWLYRFPGCAVVLGWRAAAAGACLLLPYGSGLSTGLLGSLVLGQMYFNRRFGAFRGNSDTILLVCLSAVSVGSLPSASPRLQAAALGFVAFQAALAYFMTGYDKLMSPLWRNGVRLIQIVRDGNYRFPPLGDRLARRPRLAAACAWAVILLEIFFPLGVFLSPVGFWMFIAGGLLFHGTVAFSMGLNGFWWAFVATYPALYFVQTGGLTRVLGQE